MQYNPKGNPKHILHSNRTACNPVGLKQNKEKGEMPKGPSPQSMMTWTTEMSGLSGKNKQSNGLMSSELNWTIDKMRANESSVLNGGGTMWNLNTGCTFAHSKKSLETTWQTPRLPTRVLSEQHRGEAGLCTDQQTM